MATTFDIQLPHYSRGFHLITRDIVSQLPALPESGLLVVFIKHTSAGLTINCLLYTSPSPRDVEESRMPSSA